MILERVETPRGELVLRSVGEHVEIISNGVFLMDTRSGGSERWLAEAALSAHPGPTSVLIGGLGVGFTLAAVVAEPCVASVTVVEVEPVLVDWHRSVLAGFSAHALDDPRVTVLVADVVDHLAGSDASYDVICLDVDNGPDWTVAASNDRLYTAPGTALLRRRLHPGGVLAVWSSRAVPVYETRLRTQFDFVLVHEVATNRGGPDVIYVATDEP